MKMLNLSMMFEDEEVDDRADSNGASHLLSMLNPELEADFYPNSYKMNPSIC